MQKLPIKLSMEMSTLLGEGLVQEQIAFNYWALFKCVPLCEHLSSLVSLTKRKKKSILTT